MLPVDLRATIRHQGGADVGTSKVPFDGTVLHGLMPHKRDDAIQQFKYYTFYSSLTELKRRPTPRRLTIILQQLLRALLESFPKLRSLHDIDGNYSHLR